MGEGESFKRCPQCDADIERMLQALRGIAELSFCVQCHFPLLLVANKYRLQRLIGRGGFGEIYLAHHVHLSHDFERVVKVLKPEVFAQKGMEQRFQREVHLTSILSRENNHIVRIYDDFGEIPQWGRFYVMEYLKGVPLTRLLENPDHLPPLPLCFHIFRQLCEAMEAAHRHGVVHRDIKPDNIFLVRQHNDPYFVKVIDFGIAKPLDRVGDRSFVATQGVLGTPLYMSPEQWEDTPVDHRTDIYAMGVVLYEMLTGRTPFWDRHASRSPRAIMLDHLETLPPPIQELCPHQHVPPVIEQLILRSLAKSPHDRFASVRAWRQELEHAFVKHRLWPARGWQEDFDPEVEWGSIDIYLRPKPRSSPVASEDPESARPGFVWPRDNSEDWQRQRLQSLGQWQEGMAFVETHPVDQQVRIPPGLAQASTPQPRSSGDQRPVLPHPAVLPESFVKNTNRSGPYDLHALHPRNDPDELPADVDSSSFRPSPIWLWASLLVMIGILGGSVWFIVALQQTRPTSLIHPKTQGICGLSRKVWPSHTLRVLIVPLFSASSPPSGPPQQIRYRRYMQQFFAQTLKSMVEKLGHAGISFVSWRISDISFAEPDPQQNQTQSRMYGTHCGADIVLSGTWLTSHASPSITPSVHTNHTFTNQRTWLRLFLTDTRISPKDSPSLSFLKPQDVDELLQVDQEDELQRSRIQARIHALAWLTGAHFVRNSRPIQQILWERAKTSLARVGILLTPLTAHTPEPPRLSEQVLVPEGPFLMGASEQTQQKEIPAFWIDRYEVSREAYAICILQGQCSLIERWLDPPWHFPRDRVNPEQAQAFCQSLGKKLPTEEQWVKAARGGLSLGSQRNPMPNRSLVWGNQTPDCRHANLKWCFKIKLDNQTIPIPVPVHHQLLDRSVYGVFHLMGNVSEILRDGSIKGGNGFGDVRLISWKEHMDQRSGLQWVGFRCVREIP